MLRVRVFRGAAAALGAFLPWPALAQAQADASNAANNPLTPSITVKEGTS